MGQCNWLTPYSWAIDPEPFIDADRYPDLTSLTESWREIRDEAVASATEMTFLADNRVGPTDWAVLPLWLEEDDRHVLGEELCAKNRLLVPTTVGLLSSIGPVEAASFSSLAPGASIAGHCHHRPFVTASLCLDGDEDASISVGGQTRCYTNGAWIVFDYTQSHSVVNRGPNPRIVLLVLLAPPKTSTCL